MPRKPKIDDDAKSSRALSFHNEVIGALCRAALAHRNGEDMGDGDVEVLTNALHKLPELQTSIRSINRGTAFPKEPSKAAIITAEDQL